jgi:hypothetical protein
MNKQTEIESKLSTIAEMIESPNDNWWKMGFEVLELCELYAGAVDVEVDWSHGIYEASEFDLMAALYWHYSDYSEGQASHSYKVQCALSQLYKPGTSETSNWLSSVSFIFYKLLAEKESLDLKNRQGKLLR